MRSGKQKGQQDIEKGIHYIDDIKDNDAGGEEQSPCSLPRPRGCVECVA